MAMSSGLTHMLAEISPLSEVYSVLGHSARLKYTCMCASKKYLALGSNTGSAYVFSRDTLKYLQVVYGDTAASQVTIISISPGDQYIALALSTGQINVFELNIEKHSKPHRVRSINDHSGNLVTSFAWEVTASKLFAGDNSGKVSIIYVPTSKSKMFSVPSEVIAYLESPVYQMDWWKDKLLVSTRINTNLFDTTKHHYSVIGTKKRDGEFGSCFFLEPSSQCPVIYCARPSSRMWEVGFDGKVLNTHQIKQLLAVQPIPVLKFGEDSYDCVSTEAPSGHSANFAKMFKIGQFIVTWSAKGLYVFDPINVKVLLWTQSVKDIRDMAVCNSDVYLFLDNGTVCRLVLLPIYQLFTILTKHKRWSLMASLLLVSDVINIRHNIVKRVNKDLLQSLLTGLREQGKSVDAEKVQAMLEDVSEGSLDSISSNSDFVDTAEIMGHTYLPSGMVVVSEGLQFKPGEPGVKGLNPLEKGTSSENLVECFVDSRSDSAIKLYRRNEGESDDHSSVKSVFSDSEKEDASTKTEANSENVSGNGEPNGFDKDFFAEEILSVKKETSVEYSDTVRTVLSDNENEDSVPGKLSNSDVPDGKDSSGDKILSSKPSQSNDIENMVLLKDDECEKGDVEINGASVNNKNSTDEKLKESVIVNGNQGVSSAEPDSVEKSSHLLDNGSEKSVSVDTQSPNTDSGTDSGFLSGIGDVDIMDDKTSDKSDKEVDLSQNMNGDFKDVSEKHSHFSEEKSNSEENLNFQEKSSFEKSSSEGKSNFEEKSNPEEISFTEEKSNLEEKSGPQEKSNFEEKSNFDEESNLEEKNVEVAPSPKPDEKDESLKPVVTDSDNLVIDSSGGFIHEVLQSSPLQSSKETSLQSHTSEEIQKEMADKQIDFNQSPVPHFQSSEKIEDLHEKGLESETLTQNEADENGGGSKLYPLGSEEEQHVQALDSEFQPPVIAKTTVDESVATQGAEESWGSSIVKEKERTGAMKKFSSIDIDKEDTGKIAVPSKTSRKKRKKKSGDRVARSVSIDPRPASKIEYHTSWSQGGESEDRHLFQSVDHDFDFDTISMDTISSIEEEGEMQAGSRLRDQLPDTLSCGGDFEITASRKWSIGMSPPDDPVVVEPKPTEAAIREERRRRSEEVIPPLRDRLARAQGYSNEDGRDRSPSSSSLTNSGEYSYSSSPRPSLAAFKDGLSLKLKSQTKSFINSIKGKNLLNKSSAVTAGITSALVKSSSSPMLNELDLPQDQKMWQEESTVKSSSGDTMDGLVDADKEDHLQALAVVNIQLLYSTGQKLQRRLSEWTALTKPGVVKEILTQWAQELNAAMKLYHRELRIRQAERDRLRKAERLKKKLEKAKAAQAIDSFDKDKNLAQQNGESSQLPTEAVKSLEGSSPDTDNASPVPKNSSDSERTGVYGQSTSSSFDETDSVKNGKMNPQDSECNSDSDDEEEESRVKTRIRSWTEVLHTSDPFHLTNQQLSLFQSLTTLCFLSGITGNILHTLGFHSNDHFTAFIQSLSPSDTYVFQEYVSYFVEGDIQSESIQTHSSPTSSNKKNIVSKDLMSAESRSRTVSTGFTPGDDSNDYNKVTNDDNLQNMGSEMNEPVVSLPDGREVEKDSEGIGEEEKDTSNLLSKDEKNVAEVVSVTEANSSSAPDILQKKISEEQISTSLSSVSHVSGAVGKEDEPEILSVSSSVSGSSSHSLGSSSSERDKILNELSLALFLKIYFFLLDYDKLKAEVDRRDSILVWASLLQCSLAIGSTDIVSTILADGQINSAFDYLRSGILPYQSALLGHVHRLFGQAANKTCEFCSEQLKQITPVDILWLCQMRGLPSSPVLLKYVRRVMVDVPPVHRSVAFSKLCQWKEVRQILWSELLNSMNPELPPAVDGTRSLASQLMTVLPQNWLSQLCEVTTSTEEREEVVQMSLQSKCWPVCITMLKLMGEGERLLQLILDIDDVSLISNTKDGYLPQSQKEWEFLVQQFHLKLEEKRKQLMLQKLDSDKDISDVIKTEDSNNTPQTGFSQESTMDKTHADIVKSHSDTTFDSSIKDSRFQHLSETDSNSGKRNSGKYIGANRVVKNRGLLPDVSSEDKLNSKQFTWHSLGYLLLKHLGGVKTLDFLTEYSHDLDQEEGGLKAELLSACYTQFRIQMEQSHITHEMLEKLSMYLWTKKPEFVTPVVHHAVAAERKLSETGKGEHVRIQGMMSQIGAFSNTELLSEYLAGHWGQEVKIASLCLGCNVALKSVVSLTAPGVVVFPCGHAFHKFCVPTSVCPLHSGSDADR